MKKSCPPVVLTVLLLAAVLAECAGAEDISADVENAALNEDWPRITDLCADKAKASDSPTLRVLNGHACLALNRNNESFVLFLSLASEAERQAWLSWTSAFLDKNPNSAIAYYFKGDALARIGKWDDTLECYTRALSISPKMKLALNARGVAYASRADWFRAQSKREHAEAFWERARADLTGVCSDESKFAEGYASLGNLQLMRHASKGALRSYNEALEINPAFAVALNGRACAHFGELEWAEASRDFNEAGRLLPIPLFLGNLRAITITAENLSAPDSEQSPLFRFSDFLDWETLRALTLQEGDVLRTLLGAPLPEKLNGDIIDKINQRLEAPAFYDSVKDRLDLGTASPEMLNLIEQTGKYRAGEIALKTNGIGGMIVLLNRLVIELAYPNLIAKHTKRDPGMQLAVGNGQLYHGDKLDYMRNLSDNQLIDGQNRVNNLWRPMADLLESMPLVGSLGKQWNRHLDTASNAANIASGERDLSLQTFNTGGVSTEMKRVFVNQSNWPVVSWFGLTQGPPSWDGQL